MKKHLTRALFLLFSVFAATAVSQQPYIVPAQGLGQYGYLEVNATTYARMNSNTFGARELAARWWTGAEYIYYAGDFGSCTTHESSTSDYSGGNHANWAAGTVAYVSVRFKQCDFNWNGTNYNERSFQLVDIDNAYDGSFDDAVSDNPTGTQNLVGSFTVRTGGSSLTLDRLWLANFGNAQEGTDIPNDGIRIYYEAITGSETYNGTESYRILYGDYGGNGSGNEQWGSDDLNLPVGPAGVRCYVVVSDLAATYTGGMTVQFQIRNDGISFQETRDGSYNLLRIDATATSPAPAPLPVELAGFRATLKNQAVRLEWETVSEIDNDHFEVQRSEEALHWKELGRVNSRSPYSMDRQVYSFEDLLPQNGLNYYRLRQVDVDGQATFSPVALVKFDRKPAVSVAPNPAGDELLQLTLPPSEESRTIRLLDGFGRALQTRTAEAGPGETIYIDLAGLPSGVLFLQADGSAPVRLVKL